MDSASPPVSGGESADLLHALRHALADPLSAAALKLDLVERRLLGTSGADPAWLAERVRAMKSDVDAATRLLGLLPDLAAISGERPVETSLAEVCVRAGVGLDETAAAAPRMALRGVALADALRRVATFLAEDRGVLPPGRVDLSNDRVALFLEGTRAAAGGPPARLLDLPHGNGDAEALFVARAAAVADGGRLDLIERAGRVAAIFSWPLSSGRETGREPVP